MRLCRVLTANGIFVSLFESRIVGDASWALLGQIGSGIVLLLGTRVLTELVTPEVFGQVALMVGIVALGVNNFSSPFVFAGMRLLPETIQKHRRSDLMHILRGLISRSVTLAIVLMAIGCVVYGYVGENKPWLFVASGLLLVATVRRDFGVQLLIGERRQREASLWQTCDSILRPVIAISLVLWGRGDAVLILLGYTLASFAANTIWFKVHRGDAKEIAKPRSSAYRRLRKEILAYAWPLIPLELVGWFNTLGDRYVIGYLMTATDVGIYAAAYTLINEAFNRSSMVLLRTFQPVYFNHFSRDQSESARRVFRIWLICVVAVGLGGVLALVLLKSWVTELLLAEAYQSAAVLMPIIGMGCALQAAGVVLAQPLYARKRTRLVLRGRVAGVISAAISIPVMVKWQGLMGAAIAAPIYFGTEALVVALIAKPWLEWVQVAHQKSGDLNES
ncbi:lipopolysaccharide biosynthesis protein [Methylomicrobium sp. Wu6]|uniref:lipopolysaccharide biosynthesis protein n=1 Tax=Methylomicrobium sp. Wu6 TaxID=3107928 RepID=UPI002DD63CCA|nr:lipopolysaccharide biosynthesis protein [Methylomicrobium sp. Wu6]MEC4750310.1 lipopolysaccharide biosynthesis protein [Methylomicrobium sp. Wu6]